MTADGASSESPGPPEPHEFRWQALFQQAREPVFVLNRRRRILFVNHAWENLTRVSAAEARGLVCPRRPPSGKTSSITSYSPIIRR